MKATRTAALVFSAALIGCDEPADDLSEKSDATKTHQERREKATGGVGKKGRYNTVYTSVSVYFGTKQKLTFLQIEYAVKLYKAEHERFPKSWDEFKKEIIDRNNFKLPELPEGDEYVFDSEKGQLMVEHPPK